MRSDAGIRNAMGALRGAALNTWLDEHGPAVAEGYDSGLSITTLARKYACAETRIKAALKRAGVTMRPRPGRG